jgi:hypothetical protein
LPLEKPERYYKINLIDTDIIYMLLHRHKLTKHFSYTGGQMPHSPTYDELIENISINTDRIVSICNSLKDKFPKTIVFFRILQLTYIIKKLFRQYNKMEAYCITCTKKECNRIPEVKSHLEKSVERMKLILKKLQKKKYPKIIIRIQQHLINELQNKLEDYIIASDEEINILATQITEKITKGHGLQIKKSC